MATAVHTVTRDKLAALCSNNQELIRFFESLGGIAGTSGLSIDELLDLIMSAIATSLQPATHFDTLPDVVQPSGWVDVLQELMQPQAAHAVPEMVMQQRDFGPDIAAAVTAGVPGANILRYITPSLWPAILNGTSTVNVATMVNTAFSNERVIFMPRGRYTITAPITIPLGVSVVGYQANIVCDFTTPATWGLPIVPVTPENPEEGPTIDPSESWIVRCILLPGMNGAALTVDDMVAEVSGLVVTSVNPQLVRATAFFQQNGAYPSEPVAVLYSKYNFSMSNIMVDGFDTAFYFGSMRQSSFFRLKSRNTRVGIDLRGRNIWTPFLHCDLYTDPGTVGVPGSGWKAATLFNTGLSTGVNIDAFYRGGVYPINPERGEDQTFEQCCVLGFNTCFNAAQGLLIKITKSTIDSSTLQTGGTIYTSGAAIKVNTQEQVIIRDNWISGFNNGIVCGAHNPASPPDMLLIEGNQFHHNIRGVYASDRANMRIVGNTFKELTLYDVRLANVDQVVVNGNQSTGNTQAGATATSMLFTGISNAEIDNNNTTLPVAVAFNPTSNNGGKTNNTVRIGRNAGVTYATFERVKTAYAAAATAAVTFSKFHAVAATLGYVPRVDFKHRTFATGGAPVISLAGSQATAADVFNIDFSAAVTGDITTEASAIWTGDA